MQELVAAIVSVALALVGLALLATLVSPHANTAKVIQAATQGFGFDINAATNPFSGSSTGVNSITGGGVSSLSF